MRSHSSIYISMSFAQLALSSNEINPSMGKLQPAKLRLDLEKAGVRSALAIDTSLVSRGFFISQYLS